MLLNWQQRIELMSNGTLSSCTLCIPESRAVLHGVFIMQVQSVTNLLPGHDQVGLTRLMQGSDTGTKRVWHTCREGMTTIIEQVIRSYCDSAEKLQERVATCIRKAVVT